jgi:hypothetical protein
MSGSRRALLRNLFDLQFGITWDKITQRLITPVTRTMQVPGGNNGSRDSKILFVGLKIENDYHKRALLRFIVGLVLLDL